MFNICIYVQYTHILFLYIYIQTLLFKSGSKDPTRPAAAQELPWRRMQSSSWHCRMRRMGVTYQKS
jgi:hypothetical protein